MPGIGIGLGIGLGGGAGGGASLAADKTSYLTSVAAGALIATVADPYGSGSTFSVVGSAPAQLALASAGRIVAGSGAQTDGVTSTIVVRAVKGQRAVEEPLAFTAKAPTGTPTPTPGTLTISGAPAPASVGSKTIFTPLISGGTPPYTLSLTSGTLPAGRSISGLTVSGTYTTAATYNYALRVTDSAGTFADLPLSVTVASAASASAANFAKLNKDGTDLAAVLGGSRDRQNGVGAGNQIRALTSGALTWAYTIGRRFRTAWYYSTGIDQNSNNMGGMLFANDGEGAQASYRRLPALIASDAQIVFVPMSSNSVQFNDFDINNKDLGVTFSAANYVGVYQQVILQLIAAGKAVIVADLVERGVYLSDGTTLVGGVWLSGSQPRSQVPTINSLMKTWCQQQGIPFLEMRPTITTTQVNGGTTDTVPIPDYVRSDSTHWSTRGAYVIGKLYDALLTSLGFTSALPNINSAAAGNLFANPMLNSAGGTVGSGFAAGSTAPAGVTTSRSGTTATISSASIVKGGKTWLEFVVDTSAMATGVQEAINLVIAAAASASGSWYAARVRYEVDVFDAVYGTVQPKMYSGANSSVGLMPVDNGGSGVTDATSLAMIAGPTEAYTGIVEAMPMLSVTTTASLNITLPSFRKSPGAQIFRVRVTDIEFRQVSDPTLLMYDETNTTAPVLTSQTALTAPEETPYQTILTASKPVRWTISGTDAGQFSVDRTGTVKMNATPDYEAPVDANADNIYNLNVVMTDFNPNVPAVTQAITLTIQDIADGTIYPFTGADGTDLADLYPGVVRTGTAGALAVASNTARNVSTSNPTTGYVFPQEGNTVDQEVRWKATSSSATIRVAVRLLDKDNGIFCDVASGQLRVYKMIAGTMNTIMVALTSGITGTGATGAGLYKSIANGDNFICQIIDGVLRLFQNGALCGSVPVAGLFDGTAGSTAVYRAGLLSNPSTGSTNTIDNFNVRPAMAITPKVVLKTLTLTDQTKVAGQPYAGVMSYYYGQPSMSVSTDTSGLFFVDGYNLRTTGPLGVSGTSYSVTVSEPNDNSVNAPKTTTFTILVP